MTGVDLKTARSLSHWTQAEAAQRLGVTQAYLSMVESGTRPVSAELGSTALKVYPLPATARPLGTAGHHTEEFFTKALGELGYPGFTYLKSKVSLNPAELLLLALDTDDLDARVTEALPWLPFHFPDMNWEWLARETKLRDRQNRLAYVTALAHEVAEANENTPLAATLALRVAALERSRLAKDDTLCKESMTRAERRWLRSHRSPLAAHWNLLTDLKLEDLRHVACETPS